MKNPSHESRREQIGDAGAAIFKLVSHRATAVDTSGSMFNAVYVNGLSFEAYRPGTVAMEYTATNVAEVVWVPVLIGTAAALIEGGYTRLLVCVRHGVQWHAVAILHRVPQ